MDAEFNIYELSDKEKENPTPEVVEDAARLDSYLKRRAENDRIKREKFTARHGKLIWDSQQQGTYRKNQVTSEDSTE